MRLLQVCAVDFTAFHLLRPLMLGCRAEGWDIEFACAEGPWAARLRQEGFPHRAVPMSRAASVPRQIVAITALARSLRTDPPDLIHTHTPVGGFVGRSAALLAGRRPIVHTFHGLPFENLRRSALETVFLMTERALAKGTDLFFSQASGDVDRAVDLGIARRADTIVIGNGVDVESFTPQPDRRDASRRLLGLGPRDIAVLTVARLVREKGLLELAEAAQRLAHNSSLHFLVAGTALTSDRTDVRPQLEQHPVAAILGNRWRLLGYRSDIADLLQAADIFVLPSYREGLPRSVIEAMASRVAVVATSIPACEELLAGEVGLLVPTMNAPALATAIELLALDTTLRSTLAKRGRARAVEMYDERLVVQRQIDALRRFQA
jgi:glycosyltransferase involved in cell wall biosynthesis